MGAAGDITGAARCSGLGWPHGYGGERTYGNRATALLLNLPGFDDLVEPESGAPTGVLSCGQRALTPLRRVGPPPSETPPDPGDR